MINEIDPDKYLIVFSFIEMSFDLIFEMLVQFGTFVQFEKREKLPWRSVTFSKVSG